MTKRTRLQFEVSAEELEEQFAKDQDRHGSLKAFRNRSKAKGYSAKDLTVLSPQVDPYRRDTPTNHANARWFADQIARFIPTGDIHLRGLHYKCNGNVFLPSGGISQGMPYINTN